jgi:hypothetical protein
LGLNEAVLFAENIPFYWFFFFFHLAASLSVTAFVC